jgi:hypothetical protein
MSLEENERERERGGVREKKEIVFKVCWFEM